VRSTTLDAAAARLAELLTVGGGGLADGDRGDLEFDPEIELRALARRMPPSDVWAVDGGQALVADARCLQLIVTRASRVRYRAGACALEDEGELRAHLLGGIEGRVALESLELGLPAETATDVNLLRDRWEWDAVARSIDDCEREGMVLVDGDLQPDWRIPSSFMADLLARADERGVLVAAVTKHSSLSRGGAPLLGQLEREAADVLGARATWWARVAHTRHDLGGFQVLVARLDPDARYAFRVDLPTATDAEAALGAISALSDDAAFPGYPYPLTVADRLAACPPWLRADVRMQLDELFDLAGVPLDVRERAFADRHDLMERA